MASGNKGPTRGRNAQGLGLAVLNRISQAPVLDKLGLRKQVDKVVYEATKAGFTTAAAASRTFRKVQGNGKPARPASASRRDLFDLTPSEEQQMIRDTVAEFAAELVRPAAAEADDKCAAPDGLVAKAAELGVTQVGVPEELGGVGGERSAVTNVLIAEALAHGDMGLAVACLAPSAVSTALVLWGDSAQQSTYLPSFVGENVPSAALAVQEPRALFDPFTLRTSVRRTPGGFVIDGVKSLVPQAASAELFVVAAHLPGSGPVLLVVESSTAGLTVESEPAMGLRAAGLGRLVLDNVTVPASALLGEGRSEVYTECVRLSRLAWSALSLGTAQAVLDYVIPYVNERQAFGEPIANRQGVAFKVADIGIELEAMRLLTYKAASRVEQGLPHAREVALARKLCADKGMVIGNDGVQLLGGHGFVKEHPVERWYRDLRAIGLMEGVVLV
ncbi:acyl-CoA dehydrogenase family protein [Streptomyces sp. B1866]|uniref:acyl-CoA dehydrogenase family protein n=1 Tax=Streptomyces sp. B1866 TaxID=3075431 RepID=UPI00288E89B0|nr:acyl-CoA dehydrogenase family protein [Streptomyces sp. B1866]MDT3397777.1 acyl-CoA dehydrogenase family protein [Streptomyces sp. B1866]